MSSPSLVLVPSVYKAGTLYTEVPFDGTGDMVVTRNSPATRVNEDGFIELLGRNLLFNSENFSTNWFANQITVQSSTTDFPGPFGNEAVQCNPQPVAGAKSLTSMTPTLLSYNSGVVYTASVCVYVGIGQYVQITFPSGPFGALGYANYDIINNSVAFIAGGTDVNRSAKIEPISGTGWVRCIFTATSSGGNSNGIIIASVPNATSARLESYTPSSSDYFFLSSAQVEIGSTASKYEISTSATNNTPRLDYLQPDGSIGCPALLVEPSAQNTCLQSADFNTTWQSINSATVNTNTAISPDGTQNADTINLAAVNNSRVRQPITLANSTTYTISCFYKNIALTAGETFGMRFDNGASSPNNFVAAALIDLASGTATYSLTGTSGTGFSGTATGRVDNYGNGWYRVLLTFTVGSAGGGLGSFEVGYISPGVVRSFYAWGAQVETGSVATSYIPTTTQAITRNADVIRKTGITSLIGQSEGTVYFELEVTDEARNRWFCSVDSAANSFIQMFITSTRLISVSILNGGSVVMANLTSSVLSVGYHKIAFAYNTATNGCIMYIDGVQNPAATTRTVVAPGLPAFNNVSFGTYLSTTVDTLKAHVRAGALYTTRLPNYLLESETSQIQSYSALASSLSYTIV